jgi:hypothetical protein
VSVGAPGVGFASGMAALSNRSIGERVHVTRHVDTVFHRTGILLSSLSHSQTYL